MGERDQLRHDLRNVMTAFDIGSMLLEKRLSSSADDEVREVLGELRAAAGQGRALLDRLRELEREDVPPGA